MPYQSPFPGPYRPLFPTHPLPETGWIVHYQKSRVTRVTGVKRTNEFYAHSDQGSFQIRWFKPTREEAVRLLIDYWTDQENQAKQRLGEIREHLDDAYGMLVREE